MAIRIHKFLKFKNFVYLLLKPFKIFGRRVTYMKITFERSNL